MVWSEIPSALLQMIGYWQLMVQPRRVATCACCDRLLENRLYSRIIDAARCSLSGLGRLSLHPWFLRPPSGLPSRRDIFPVRKFHPRGEESQNPQVQSFGHGNFSSARPSAQSGCYSKRQSRINCVRPRAPPRIFAWGDPPGGSVEDAYVENPFPRNGSFQSRMTSFHRWIPSRCGTQYSVDIVASAIAQTGFHCLHHDLG